MLAFFYMLYNLFFANEMDRAELTMEMLNMAYPEWRQEYKVGEFDCSNQAAFIDEVMEFMHVETELQVKSKLGSKTSHAFLTFKNYPAWAIEPVELKIVNISRYRDYKQNYLKILSDPEYQWQDIKYLKGEL